MSSRRPKLIPGASPELPFCSKSTSGRRTLGNVILMKQSDHVKHNRMLFFFFETFKSEKTTPKGRPRLFRGRPEKHPKTMPRE
eukprot:3685671-Karenia_brevis.AAC.1